METTKPTLAIYGIQDCNEQQTFVHDHNLCLMENGKVTDFVQLERVTRVKRDNSLQNHIDALVRDKKWINKELDLVFVDNVLGRAFINQQGNIRFEAPLSVGLKAEAEKGRAYYYGREPSAFVLNHELAHIATCLPFYGNFKDNSLLIHFDGGASQSNFSAWLYKDGEIKLLEAHWKYQWLSSIFNANALVFAVIGANIKSQNSVPGKMMGLAGHGEYKAELEAWLRDNKFFANIWNCKKHFFDCAWRDWGIKLSSFDQKNPFIQNCIASLHEIFIRELIDILRQLEAKHEVDYLYYSGGSALNIVANTRIVESGIFQDVFIPPCCEDSGLALGAAAFIEQLKGNNIDIHSAYLNNYHINKEGINYSEEDIKQVGDLLADGKIVGVCNGFGEAGPRALGNRSLLALANSKALSKKLSMDCKGREWYRPLAPIMLEKNAKYFTGKEEVHHLSKYMLLDFPIQSSKQTELIGAMNKDGSARIQTIFSRSENLFIWDLLKYLDEVHQIKVLINTSFNAQGEPIVHRAEDAKKAAQNLGIDALVVDGRLNKA